MREFRERYIILVPIGIQIVHRIWKRDFQRALRHGQQVFQLPFKTLYCQTNDWANSLSGFALRMIAGHVQQ